MAFTILKNVSKRYTDNPGVAQSESGSEASSESGSEPGSEADDRSRLIPSGPISLRQPDDETDTDSVTDEEPAVDDSPELPTPLSRAQRRALARWRLNNTKQYYGDGL